MCNCTVLQLEEKLSSPPVKGIAADTMQSNATSSFSRYEKHAKLVRDRPKLITRAHLEKPSKLTNGIGCPHEPVHPRFPRRLSRCQHLRAVQSTNVEMKT